MSHCDTLILAGRESLLAHISVIGNTSDRTARFDEIVGDTGRTLTGVVERRANSDKNTTTAFCRDGRR
jgi:hypothetical protein